MVAVIQEDACSICYGDMHERGTKFAPELVWCQQGCGHNVHARCLNVWAKHQVTHVLKAAVTLDCCCRKTLSAVYMLCECLSKAPCV